MKDMIPTINIELSQTKLIVELYEFLTTGETRKIQKILLDSNVDLNNQDKTVDSKKARVFLDMQDQAVTFLVKSVKKQTDQSVESLQVGDLFEWVSNLPNEDGKQIYDKVTDIINVSMLSDDAKKN